VFNKTKLIMENWKRFIRENVNKDFKIFLDMDGVLVAFSKGHAKEIISLIQQDPEKITSRSTKKALRKIKSYNGEDREEITVGFLGNLLVKKDNKLDMTKWEKLIKSIQFKVIGNNKDYWSNLEKAEGCDELVKGCRDLVGYNNVYILSAPIKGDEESYQGKLEWLKNSGLGFDEDHIFLNPNKEEITNQFLDSTCILVDDREKYIVKFTDQNLQNPGIGVHHTPKASMNGVNNSLNKLKEIIKTS
tara:strand:- start:221 stop:958 length:738 start_codon:yes stop_codon:yes gene_type:complete